MFSRMVIISLALAATAFADVSQLVTLGEDQVAELPDGSKIVLLDDHKGKGVELWATGHGVVKLARGNWIQVGKYRVFCEAHDLKGDRATLRVVGPGSPRRNPPRPVEIEKPKPKPKPVVKPKPPPPKRHEPRHVRKPEPTRTYKSKTELKPQTPPTPPVPTVFELPDKVLNNQRDLVAVSNNGQLVNREDVPGDPGLIYTVKLSGDGWREVWIKDRADHPRRRSGIAVGTTQHFDQWQMKVFNPNHFGTFAVALYIKKNGRYTATEWKFLKPRQGTILSLDVHTQPHLLDEIGFRIGANPKDMPSGNGFQVEISAVTPIPDILLDAERHLFDGRVNSIFYRRFADAVLDSKFRFKQRVMLGLYATHLAISEGETHYRDEGREWFSKALEISATPYEICPSAWTTGAKAAWETLKHERGDKS